MKCGPVTCVFVAKAQLHIHWAAYAKAFLHLHQPQESLDQVPSQTGAQKASTDSLSSTAFAHTSGTPEKHRAATETKEPGPKATETARPVMVPLKYMAALPLTVILRVGFCTIFPSSSAPEGNLLLLRVGPQPEGQPEPEP